METLNEIRAIAVRQEWHEIDHQEKIGMISFIRKDSRINVYYLRPWRMTVATTVNHPTWGRQQLFRKFIRLPELREIFKNPRVHTDRGYYRKYGKSKQKMAKPAISKVSEV